VHITLLFVNVTDIIAINELIVGWNKTMQRFWKKASVINKLIISYVLLLLLPSFIIWGYLFPQMQQRMIDNTLNNQEYNIARLSGAIDMHLSTLVADSVTFAANPELSPYAIKRNTMGEYEAVREIRKVLHPVGLFPSFSFF
jgi:hypothetical protein